MEFFVKNTTVYLHSKKGLKLCKYTNIFTCVLDNM